MTQDNYIRRTARALWSFGLLLLALTASAQFSYTTIGSNYTQNFDGILITVPANNTVQATPAWPTGWAFSEAGSGANTTYRVHNGSVNTGDTYLFGTTSSSERAIGSLISGSVGCRYGFYMTNNTGQTINSVAISYTGETWRIGTASRSDRLDFEYSTDATSLTTGTWTTYDALDYANPGQALANGSMVHSASISSTITGLCIPNGATLYVRWLDFDASGADDGMGVDDFSLTATTVPTIISDVTSFTGSFGNVTVGSSSAASSFTVSGCSLTNDLLITPPAGFEVRVPPAAFQTAAINLGPGTVATTTIEVRFTPLAGGAISDNVVISSVGATSQNIPVDGTGNAANPPTQLAITSINGGGNVIQNTGFSVTVEAQDGSNNPQNVAANTGISIVLNTGFGTLGGTLTGIILAGTSSVVISGITYDSAEDGIVLDAQRTSGDVLTTGSSAPFNVLGQAQDLSFSGVPVGAVVNATLGTFQVDALRGDATIATEFTGAVTIGILSGPGNISGTLTQNAVNGSASFPGISFDTPGQYILQATGGGLNPGTSPTITITVAPTLTELVVPQFFGSKSAASSNNTRTPVTICVAFNDLLPNVNYKMDVGLALPGDALTGVGAGNKWNAGVFQTGGINNAFVTDANGYSGVLWIHLEVTGNGTRFDAGQVHQLRFKVVPQTDPYPTNVNFVGTKTLTALDLPTTARTPATTDDGAYLRGSAAACAGGNYVLAYNNEAGTGDPLSVYMVRPAAPAFAATNLTGHPAAIAQILEPVAPSVDGDFALIIPIGANNPNGIRRLELRNANNDVIQSNTDADGIWGAANTTTIARRGVASISYDALPVVTCPGDLNACVNDAVITLGGESPLGGTWSGTGVSGNSFDPAAADIGANTVTYTYTNNIGCSNSCQLTITVDDDQDSDGICDAIDDCDTFPGMQGDACNDGNNNTVLDVITEACVCAGTACTTNLDLIFNPDGVTNIQWELRQQGSNIVVQSGGGVYPATPEYSITTCLPNGNYYLVVTSNTGGIVQNGYQGGYRLRTSGGLMVVDNRNNFLSGSTSQIAGGEGFSIPLSTDRTIFTSSDKLDWQNNEYIYATDNPTVTAQYGVNNANSGYQMWWYNPNGGYSFRRFQNHNTSNGLPASATRACGFRVNGWSGNQLQDGTLYNVKVRSMVNGVYGNWGAATRFRIDAARAQCPLTNLMDLPGNQFLSCGGTRALGTSQPHLVHARPVKKLVNGAWVNANRYQFRFISENTIIKTSNTNQYWVYTGSAPSLAAGVTYEVEVRASFDNGATWCDAAPGLNPFAPKWGKVCLLTISGAAQGGNQNLAATANNAEVGLYPNPNNGQQLTLSLSQVEAGTKTVTVDILDTFGKRVSARTIAVNDTFVNTVLDLNGELAAGMYLVNITAGGNTYTERLVIQP